MGGNIPVGKFLAGNFAGRFFQPGGLLMGGNFPRIMVSKICLRLG